MPFHSQVIVLEFTAPSLPVEYGFERGALVSLPCELKSSSEPPRRLIAADCYRVTQGNRADINI